jgi:hypothetical protein
MEKKLITPLPIEQSRIWPFSDKEENCVEFVSGFIWSGVVCGWWRYWDDFSGSCDGGDLAGD